MVAAFSFTELPHGSTVRVYGRTRGRAGPAHGARARTGGPSCGRSRRSGAGASQFLVAWEGAPTADGARPLRFDVVREEAEGVRVTWSSSALCPEGLTARWYVVRGAEITVRHAGALSRVDPGL